MDQPYVFKEYPRTLHRPDGATLSVGNDDEKDAALADGWSLTPHVDLTGNRFDGPDNGYIPEDAEVQVDEAVATPARSRKKK